MVLLNNKIYTFHDLFTESIDKQQALHVQLNTINYYMCVGERHTENCFIILQISYL